MIEIINLTKTYKTKYDVITPLENINITLPNKGMVFLPGESGCGKTTFLNLIGALDVPDAGAILFDGKDISKLNSKELNEYRNYNVGFIFQDYNLLTEFNVYENLALALDLQNEKEKKEKIKKVLKLVKLQGFEKRKVKQLSGGQKQRIAIARALLKESKYILADEPTGNLDYNTSEEIFKILKNISKDRLVVVVTHDLNRVKIYGDRSIEFRNSCIHEDVVFNNECMVMQSCDNSTKEVVQGSSTSSLIDGGDNNSLVEFSDNRKLKSSLSVPQILKFSSRNMGRRIFRLSVAIIMTMVTLIGFGLAFATNITDTSMGHIMDPYYDDLKMFTTIIDQDTYGYEQGKKPFNDDAVESINENFSNKNIPIYHSDYGKFAVINQETLENFGLVVHSKSSSLDYFLPQKDNEIAKVMPKSEADNAMLGENRISYLHDLPVETISIITYDERALISQAKQVYKKLINKYEEQILFGEVTVADALERYVDQYIQMFSNLTFVTQGFIDKYFDEAVSAQSVQFEYIEYSKYFEAGHSSVLQYNKIHREGSAINVDLIEKYDNKIVYADSKNSGQPLADNEVIVSDEFAKALMSRTIGKPSDQISDDRIIPCLNNGNLVIESMSIGNEIINNPKVVGVYFDSSDRYGWTDLNDSIPYPAHAEKTILTTPPIVVSDYYYNLNRQNSVSNHPQSYILDNRENLMDADFINALDNSNTKSSEFYGDEYASVKHSMTIRESHSKIYLYLALGASVLAVLVILSYVLAVTKDSKKKIGILRAQGVSGSSVGVIFLIEALILTITAFILSIPFAILISNNVFISGFVRSSIITIKTCVIGYQSILAMAGVSIGVGVLGALAPIIIYSRKSPVELIREDL